MKSLIAATLLTLTAHTWAQAPSVEVQDAWVRATVAQQKATGAFMRLTAKADSRLVAAQSPVAAVVEIHEMAMEKDVMRMRAVPAIALPAGKAVELKPGGYHVMLMDLKAAVKAGDVVPLTLTLESAGGQRTTMEVRAEVRALGAAATTTAPADHGAMHKH